MNEKSENRAINAAIGRMNAMQAFCIYLAECLPTTTAQSVASRLMENIPKLEAMANGSAAPDSHNDAMLALLRTLVSALARQNP